MQAVLIRPAFLIIHKQESTAGEQKNDFFQPQLEKLVRRILTDAIRMKI